MARYPWSVSCRLCDRSFVAWANLLAHMRDVHQKEDLDEGVTRLLHLLYRSGKIATVALQNSLALPEIMHDPRSTLSMLTRFHFAGIVERGRSREGERPPVALYMEVDDGQP